MGAERQSFNKNLVLWGPTIIYNLIRMTIPGIIIFLVMLVGSMGAQWQVLTLGIGWLIVGLPAFLIAQNLNGLPKNIVVFLFVLPYLIIGMLADPFLFVAWKIKSEIFPIQPRFMEFGCCVFIQRP
jgi:hypothetical protein